MILDCTVGTMLSIDLRIVGSKTTWDNTLSDTKNIVLSLGIFTVRFMYIYNFSLNPGYVPSAGVTY